MNGVGGGVGVKQSTTKEGGLGERSVGLSAAPKEGYYNKDLYKDYLDDLISMIDDCDIDCQARGSQMTLFATLMGTLFGLIGLNALFMFIGTWRYRWRVCSVYCTLFMCVFQLAILAASASLLFTKYNAVCARSMHFAWGEAIPYYIADDFYWSFVIWVSGWFTMFFFCCCGLCSSYKA